MEGDGVCVGGGVEEELWVCMCACLFVRLCVYLCMFAFVCMYVGVWAFVCVLAYV